MEGSWKGLGGVLEGSWKVIGVSVSYRSRNVINSSCAVLKIVSDGRCVFHLVGFSSSLNPRSATERQPSWKSCVRGFIVATAAHVGSLLVSWKHVNYSNAPA